MSEVKVFILFLEISLLKAIGKGPPVACSWPWRIVLLAKCIALPCNFQLRATFRLQYEDDYEYEFKFWARALGKFSTPNLKRVLSTENLYLKVAKVANVVINEKSQSCFFCFFFSCLDFALWPLVATRALLVSLLHYSLFKSFVASLRKLKRNWKMRMKRWNFHCVKRRWGIRRESWFSRWIFCDYE